MDLDSNRILLVHPLGYNQKGAKHDVSRLANIMPPLGLCSMAAYMEEKGFKADIIDCFAHPDSDGKIRAYLKEHRPAFVGATCTTNGFLDAVRIIGLCKDALPEVRSIVGGPHVSAMKERVFENQPLIDYAVIGEGELTLEALMECKDGDVSGVKGLVYRANDELVFSGYPDKSMELDDLPFPAYEKLEGYPRSYQLPLFNYPSHPNASCTSSRGCPYVCSYCDRSVFRRSFRYNSADYVYRHMKYMKDRWGIKHLNFYDDQFTLNKKRVVELCTRLIDEPLGMTFNCAVRAEHVDLELLTLMRRAGCWMVSLGIETGDPDLLAQHRQNADLKMISDTIRDVKQAGIRAKGLLMLGLPGETEESVRKSKEYVFSLPLDDFNLAKFTPFPGSPLYENIHELGEFEEDYAKMDCMNFVFVTKGMTRERLDELFLDFYRSHFQRPHVLFGYVTMLWKSPHSWWRFLSNVFGFLRFIRSNKRIGDS